MTSPEPTTTTITVIASQTSYLLGLAELKEPASEWLKMLDGGVTKALELNARLRMYVREHSPR